MERKEEVKAEVAAVEADATGKKAAPADVSKTEPAAGHTEADSAAGKRSPDKEVAVAVAGEKKPVSPKGGKGSPKKKKGNKGKKGKAH